MGHMTLWDQSAVDRSWLSGPRRSRGAARPARSSRRRTAGRAGDLPLSAGQPDQFARLHAEAQRLRARIVQVQREYEAGRLSLDQELVAFRAIEREMAAIGAQMHDLACAPPPRPAPRDAWPYAPSSSPPITD